MSQLVTVAESFTPRFEIVGPLVILDISGLARLFGGPDDIGAHLHRAAPTAHIALAASQTTAALLALGRPGLSVVPAGDETRQLAALPVSVLGELERIERNNESPLPTAESREPKAVSREPQADSRVVTDQPREREWGGWSHPRSTHQASQTKRRQNAIARARRALAGSDAGEEIGVLEVLQRWGIHTLGALAVLPAADVSERLGRHGTRWQHRAIGEDARPLVPWIADVPFEATLDLEWPIEGLEPLSFVLARVLEPLVARLERADRGAAVIQTTLRLVTREQYVRTLQLPAAMRDAKTLRALVLLDLESHPPSAAIDRVQLFIEPTPARVLQWELFERAQPSPEQVSTLLARLTALAGEGHVGSPRALDSWKPGAFEMIEFRTTDSPLPTPNSRSESDTQTALRRFRLPVPARVTVRDGRPVRVHSDRHGVPGGAVVQAAGPWRTSGQWWDLTTPASPGVSHHGPHGPWDRDEWDVELAGGILYRIFVERDGGQWFIEGAVD